MTKLIFALAVAALVAAPGCKKKSHYSSDCSRAVSLVEPWTAMKLPRSDNSRVCSCNDLKVDLEYLDGDRASWEKSYEDALVAQGYAKERCSSTSCTYLKAGEKVSVQVNQVADKKKAKTIVHLIRTPSQDPPPTAPAPTGSAANQ